MKKMMMIKIPMKTVIMIMMMMILIIRAPSLCLVTCPQVAAFLSQVIAVDVMIMTIMTIMMIMIIMMLISIVMVMLVMVIVTRSTLPKISCSDGNNEGVRDF